MGSCVLCEQHILCVHIPRHKKTTLTPAPLTQTRSLPYHTGLVEELVDCSGGEEVSLESGTARKLDALHAVLGRTKAPRSLVFCNKIEACRDVENSLRRRLPEQEVVVLVYHEAIREDIRQAAMNAFLCPPGREAEALAVWRAAVSGGLPPKAHQGTSTTTDASTGAAAGSTGSLKASGTSAPPRLVLVATDRMSRGIDCMYCTHVVLYDFPRDPSEYVRRVGRTARGAGGKGTVTSLVLGRQVALAREIMGRNEKGQPVHSIPDM